MENCIYNSNDNSTIGYCKDLKAGLKKIIEDYIKQDDWDDEIETGDTIEREEFKYLIGKRVA